MESPGRLCRLAQKRWLELEVPFPRLVRGRMNQELGEERGQYPAAIGAAMFFITWEPVPVAQRMGTRPRSGRHGGRMCDLRAREPGRGERVGPRHMSAKI